VNNETTPTSVRLATMATLEKTVLPLFIDPVPTRETLRAWFDAAHVPRFKSNPTAKRGGGTVFYSVSAVEKFFRSRMMPRVMHTPIVRPVSSEHFSPVRV
jgi:hypothetical protein